ncbi:MAG: ribosome-associated translation inhibitor RaiA [Streptosporangiales bacterium]|nr:ribosome-associated translation inhibitor RaiA [Streptosporangiales bacterium]
MDIIVKGRHTGVSERFRQHVEAKLGKITRLDQKVISVDVEVSKERNPRMSEQSERVEMTIRSRGPVIRAEASSDDRFAAFDQALAKLDSRLRRLCDRRKIHRGNRAPVSVATATAGLPPMAAGAATDAGGRGAEEASTMDAFFDSVAETMEANPPLQAEPEIEAEPEPEPSDGNMVPIAMEGDGPVVVREKAHRADPMTIDQALLEMELVGHDFYLFRDKESGVPSVVYRRKGYNYGVIRLFES